MATAAPTSENTLEIPKEKISFDVWYHIAQVSVLFTFCSKLE